ncbi:hypothetical protein WA026_010968 [Henosepilachna vigintioctopunctata]|uniref:Galactose mutarotase n=1 Tax=Henosepilachna vigintioctopunctata TaxID=420089 RepID=A0AAW1UPI9_9CUCU
MSEENVSITEPKSMSNRSNDEGNNPMERPEIDQKELRRKSLEVEDPWQPLGIPSPPPPTPELTPICHYQTKAVEVIESYYGTFIDPKGDHHHIKKFTWRNYNKLTVAVINYGARIITMKAPDVRGQAIDVLLGFEDIGGCVRNGIFPLGACLGRCAHHIKDSSFYIDNKVSYLTKNAPPNHRNGGDKGFDKVVWTPYVDKSKVIMTYVSKNKEEGYPGELLCKLTFELCNRNQFRIDYEAHCTQPTVVNLTHLCYFNLAGSSQGPEEVYNHILTLNANCYTVQDEDTIPTGEIKNVVNSKFDFQIPKCLNKLIGLTPKDGYNQNYCINSSVEDQECFVGRLFHPPSGRMLEIYSSQKGAVFSTGNEFGTGELMPAEKLLNKPFNCSATSLVVGSIYKNVKEILDIDSRKDYFEMRDLIDLVKSVKLGDRENMDKIELTKMQRKYLEKIFHYCHSCEPKFLKCSNILNAIEVILKEAKPNSSMDIQIDSLEDHEIRKRIISQFSQLADAVQEEEKKRESGKIKGKGDYLYKAHCGVAITPGNYPNAVNTKNFPNVVLRPGQTYKHTTSFRFWVRAGNPNNWMKRKKYEATLEERKAARKEDEMKASAILGLGLKNT